MVSTTDKPLYVQAEIELARGKREICWILRDIAKEGRLIKVGDKKTDMLFALVIKAYREVSLTADQIGINRLYPLKEATDI